MDAKLHEIEAGKLISNLSVHLLALAQGDERPGPDRDARVRDTFLRYCNCAARIMYCRGAEVENDN